MLHHQSRFAPNVQGADEFVVVQTIRRQGATIFGFAHVEPIALDLFGNEAAIARAFGNQLNGQRIATHFAVVFHAVVGVFGFEIRPIAAIAQELQPIVTQAVFLVSACILTQKRPNFIAAGFVQTGAQLPISRPRLQQMSFDLGQQIAEPPLVPLLKGLRHIGDDGI